MIFKGFTWNGPAAVDHHLVNEVKFVGDENLADPAIALMEAWCLPDSEHPEGRIHSVYFDGPGRMSLSEKVNGDHLKRKVRIRWYDPPAGTAKPEIPAFIEIKHREGSARRKVRIQVPAPARWIRETPLDDDSWTSFLHRHAGALGEPLPLHLVPVLCISYDRRRYRCPQTGSRVAIDRRIQASRIHEAMLPCATSFRLDRAVCEFKNRGARPPPWSESLYRAGFRLRSFSKFGECMNRAIDGGVPP